MQPQYFQIAVAKYGLPWFIRSVDSRGVEMVPDRSKAKKFGKLNADDVAKRLSDAFVVREDQEVPIQIQESVMTKAAKKSAKKAAPAPKAKATTNEPQQKKLGKTREFVIDGLKKGDTLSVTFKGNAMQEAKIGSESARVIAVKQLLKLNYIEPAGEKKENVQAYKLTDSGRAYGEASSKAAA